MAVEFLLIEARQREKSRLLQETDPRIVDHRRLKEVVILVEVIDMEKKRAQVVLIGVLQETDKSVNKKKDTMIRKIVGKWKKGGSYLLEKLPKALLEPT